MHGWTPERRAKQAEAIKRWRPWESSTGPRSSEGKARVAQNAYRGAQRQRQREIAPIFAALLAKERHRLAQIRYSDADR